MRGAAEPDITIAIPSADDLCTSTMEPALSVVQLLVAALAYPAAAYCAPYPLFHLPYSNVSASGPYTRKSSPGDWERSGMGKRDSSLV